MLYLMEQLSHIFNSTIAVDSPQNTFCHEDYDPNGTLT